MDHDGVPTFIYTGVHPAVTCVATSDDDLVHWRKHPGNPVIPGPPPDLDVTGFRDHAAWREDGSCYQVVGSGIRGHGGALPLYRSSDLVDWEYLGLLVAGDAEQSGPMWECPDFFSLSGERVLVVSECQSRGLFKDLSPEGLRAVYFVGDYRDHRFEARQRGQLDLGASFYAPQSMEETGGRRLVWGWLREGRRAAAQQQAGWAGAMSLPRVLSLGPDDHLRSEPAPELEALRQRHQTLEDVHLEPEGRRDLGISGSQLEIIAEFEPADVGTLGLVVRSAPDGEEETVIAYNVADDRLEIDCRRSSLDRTTDRPLTGGSLRLPRGEPLRLHVFLDASVVEVFANGRAAASRIYPTLPESVDVRAYSRRPSPWESRGPAPAQRLARLDVWELDSIWDGSEQIPVEA